MNLKQENLNLSFVSSKDPSTYTIAQVESSDLWFSGVYQTFIQNSNHWTWPIFKILKYKGVVLKARYKRGEGGYIKERGIHEKLRRHMPPPHLTLEHHHPLPWTELKRGNSKLKFIGVQGKQQPATPPTNLFFRVSEVFTVLLWHRWNLGFRVRFDKLRLSLLRRT